MKEPQIRKSALITHKVEIVSGIFVTEWNAVRSGAVK